MKIGFTGTQAGMSEPQKTSFFFLIEKWDIESFHSGDCIGADFDAYSIIKLLSPKTTLVGHIPSYDSKRTKCQYDIECSPKPYLERNHDIVDACDILIVIPKEFKEQLRSGTWATYRYAIKKNKRTIIIWPNGLTQTQE